MYFSVSPVRDGSIEIPADFLDVFKEKRLFAFPVKLRGVNTLWICPKYVVQLLEVLLKDDVADQKHVLEKSFLPSVSPAKIYGDGILKLPEKLFSAKRLYIYLVKIDFEFFIICAGEKLPLRVKTIEI